MAHSHTIKVTIRPRLTLQYISVTFNAFGRELPDGGMNEKGLFIWEMTGGTTFDEEANRPRLFMSQWMQYQLDNFTHPQQTDIVDGANSIVHYLNTSTGDGVFTLHLYISEQFEKIGRILQLKRLQLLQESYPVNIVR